jgi:hypothetical protein
LTQKVGLEDTGRSATVVDHAALVLLDHQIMPDRFDPGVELDLVVDVRQSCRARGDLDHDHRLRHQRGALVQFAGACRHDVWNTTFIALDADRHPRAGIIDTARKALGGDRLPERLAGIVLDLRMPEVGRRHQLDRQTVDQLVTRVVGHLRAPEQELGDRHELLGPSRGSGHVAILSRQHNTTRLWSDRQSLTG